MLHPRHTAHTNHAVPSDLMKLKMSLCYKFLCKMLSYFITGCRSYQKHCFEIEYVAPKLAYLPTLSSSAGFR